jgi:hypothetical protein
MSKDFHSWVKAAHITDDHAGDLLEDAKWELEHGRLPNVKSASELRGHLRNRNACAGALKATRVAWQRYQRWAGLPAERGWWGVIRYLPPLYDEDVLCAFSGWHSDYADAADIYEDWADEFCEHNVVIVKRDGCNHET